MSKNKQFNREDVTRIARTESEKNGGQTRSGSLASKSHAIVQKREANQKVVPKKP